MVCLLYAVNTGFDNFHVGFMSRVFFWHQPATPFPSPLTANLYSDIKPDDSPAKGTKRGKGKKEKKKAADPFEKKKPKLEELKVLSHS